MGYEFSRAEYERMQDIGREAIAGIPSRVVPAQSYVSKALDVLVPIGVTAAASGAAMFGFYRIINLPEQAPQAALAGALVGAALAALRIVERKEESSRTVVSRSDIADVVRN